MSLKAYFDLVCAQSSIFGLLSNHINNTEDTQFTVKSSCLVGSALKTLAGGEKPLEC